MPWFVLYTKSRNEKVVADRLSKLSIEVFCPLVNVRRQWSDRVKMVEEPLFRSYCFVRLDEKDRAKVFDITGVVRYLFWLKKPAIVRDEEIEVIKQMLTEADHDRITVTAFEPDCRTTDCPTTGGRARISSGTFAQTEGKIIRQQGKAVTVVLDAMQVAVTVHVDKTVVI